MPCPLRSSVLLQKCRQQVGTEHLMPLSSRNQLVDKTNMMTTTKKNKRRNNNRKNIRTRRTPDTTPSEWTNLLAARLVGAAVVADKAGPTHTLEVVVADVPAEGVVLTRRRRARIKARAVVAIVTAVAQTAVRRFRQTPAEAAVVARVRRARVEVLAGGAIVAVRTEALVRRRRRVPAGGAVAALRLGARVEVLTHAPVEATRALTRARAWAVHDPRAAILTLRDL